MLWCVAGFGLFTIIFGFSRDLLAFADSAVVGGASDMVSVMVRGTRVQLATPDEMRGRVSAVNWLFIGASTSLASSSRHYAHLFGTVPP